MAFVPFLIPPLIEAAEGGAVAGAVVEGGATAATVGATEAGGVGVADVANGAAAGGGLLPALGGKPKQPRPPLAPQIYDPNTGKVPGEVKTDAYGNPLDAEGRIIPIANPGGLGANGQQMTQTGGQVTQSQSGQMGGAAGYNTNSQQASQVAQPVPNAAGQNGQTQVNQQGYRQELDGQPVQGGGQSNQPLNQNSQTAANPTVQTPQGQLNPNGAPTGPTVQGGPQQGNTQQGPGQQNPGQQGTAQQNPQKSVQDSASAGPLNQPLTSNTQPTANGEAQTPQNQAGTQTAPTQQNGQKADQGSQSAAQNNQQPGTKSQTDPNAPVQNSSGQSSQTSTQPGPAQQNGQKSDASLQPTAQNNQQPDSKSQPDPNAPVQNPSGQPGQIGPQPGPAPQNGQKPDPGSQTVAQSNQPSNQQLNPSQTDSKTSGQESGSPAGQSTAQPNPTQISTGGTKRSLTTSYVVSQRRSDLPSVVLSMASAFLILSLVVLLYLVVRQRRRRIRHSKTAHKHYWRAELSIADVRVV